MPILGVTASSISGHLIAPDTGAMFEIGMVSVGSAGASSITFSSIPSTYKHLQIRGIMRITTGTAGTNDLQIRFNSDSGSNYAYHALMGSGAAAQIGAASTQTIGTAGRAVIPRNSSGASIYGTIVTDILDYANTSKYKTLRGLGGMDNNSTNGYISLTSSLWQSTSAITSITLTDEGSGTFSQYSTFSLYGIKGA